MSQNKNYRPRLQITETESDKIWNRIALIGIIGLWLFAIYAFVVLPETVPIHFGLDGNANNWGNKITLFIFPVLATIFYFSLGKLATVPHIYNYGSTLTEENAYAHYSLAAKLIRVMRACLTLIFIFCDVDIYFAATETNPTTTGWLLPVIIGFAIVPNIWYLYRSYSMKKAAKST